VVLLGRSKKRNFGNGRESFYNKGSALLALVLNSVIFAVSGLLLVLLLVTVERLLATPAQGSQQVTTGKGI
jgi:hypothetical protein